MDLGTVLGIIGVILTIIGIFISVLITILFSTPEIFNLVVKRFKEIFVQVPKFNSTKYFKYIIIFLVIGTFSYIIILNPSEINILLLTSLGVLGFVFSILLTSEYYFEIGSSQIEKELISKSHISPNKQK